MEKNELKIVGIFLVIISIPWIILICLLGANDIGKLWKVMTGGFEWIIIILVLLIISFVLHKKFHQIYTLTEYGLGSIALVISALATIMLLFYSTTDLADDDRINSKIMYAKWEEAHENSYEVCVAEDDDGNCTSYETRCSYVPHSYYAYDEVGTTFSISREQFFAIGKRFGTPMEEKWNNYMNDHCDDGYWYYYHWNGSKETCIPSSKKHHYVNYIKASHSVLKYYGQIQGYEQHIANYPEVYEGEFGHFYINRIIDLDTLLPEYWKTTINNELCYHNSYLGPEKEINIIVYVTDRDHGFYYALHEAWCGGKKNDVIVLIGMQHFPQIEWVEIMSWTPHEGFKIKLRDRIKKMETITDTEMFVDAIVQQITAPGEDGVERLHMSDMEYLIADIVLPWWAYIISTLIVSILYLPLLYWFFTNDIMDDSSGNKKKKSMFDKFRSYSKIRNK